jgi:hypothetical protein
MKNLTEYLLNDDAWIDEHLERLERLETETEEPYIGEDEEKELASLFDAC